MADKPAKAEAKPKAKAKPKIEGARASHVIVDEVYLSPAPGFEHRATRARYRSTEES